MLSLFKSCPGAYQLPSKHHVKRYVSDHCGISSRMIKGKAVPRSQILCRWGLWYTSACHPCDWQFTPALSGLEEHLWFLIKLWDGWGKPWWHLSFKTPWFSSADTSLPCHCLFPGLVSPVSWGWHGHLLPPVFHLFFLWIPCALLLNWLFFLKNKNPLWRCKLRFHKEVYSLLFSVCISGLWHLLSDWLWDFFVPFPFSPLLILK